MTQRHVRIGQITPSGWPKVPTVHCLESINALFASQGMKFHQFVDHSIIAWGDTSRFLEPLPPMKVEPSGVWVAHLQLAEVALTSVMVRAKRPKGLTTLLCMYNC